MKFYSLCTKKTYEKNGEQKTVWLPVGTMRENDDGKRFIELNHMPNAAIYVFEPKKKENEPEFS